MPIYDLTPGRQGISTSTYQLPDQSVPESRRTPEWYANNIRYIGTFYNRWPRNAFVLEQPNDPNTATSGAGNTTAPVEMPVQYMLRMMMYYLGRQPNLDYAHLTPNTKTSNLMPDWIRGQKIFTIIQFMKDVMLQMMQNIDFSVKAMSEDAVNERKLLLDKIMQQYEMREYFDELKKMGIEINAAQGQEFELPEDAKYYAEEGYKDIDSEIATNIASHAWLFNNGMSKFLQAFVHVNTAGQCGVEHYVNNGNYYMELYEPQQLIVDSRWNDDYNRKARFVGTIFYKTPEEVFQLYPEFTYDQRQEILAMARDSTLTGDYNSSNSSITWWNYGANQLIGTIALVKGYWYTEHDLGKKKVNNEFGIKKIKTLEEDETGYKEPGDYCIEDVATCALLGNRWVINPGYVNNVAEDYYNKSKVKLPIMVYKPNMMLGESRSVASRLHELQDERDAYKFKIREMVGSSIGKAYVFKGWKFGNALGQQELFQDLKSMRIHVTTHGGEADDDERDKSVEVIDMTMDPNVLKLSEIIAAIDAEMMEIAKVSYTAMGEPQKYMGLGVMQAAMQNSSGSQYLYSGFLDYIQMNMQYAVDVLKYLYTEDDTDYPQMIIGKRGVQYLKVAKSLRYSNPLTFLTINDFIDAKTKEKLLEDAHAAIQTGDLKFLDLVHIQTAKTYTELKGKLIYGLKKNDKQKEREAAYEQMMKQLMQENKNMSAQLQELIRSQGAVAAQQTKASGDMANMALGNAYQMMQPQEQQTSPVSN